MNLKARLEALERQLQTGFVTLQMADGTTRSVRCRRLIDIISEVARGIVKEDARAIMDAVSDNCPSTGNGFMTDVIRVMHAGPVESRDSLQETIQ